MTTTIDWRAIHHRWWVEYNPMPLLSAALVLGGLTLLGSEASFRGPSALLLSGAVEVYAFGLIGGAAFLYRIGRERAAVMLGLIAVLFQADLTMHVEASAYMRDWAAPAASAWLAVFVLKLVLLAKALRLRLSKSAWASALFGAAGLAAFPILIRRLGPDVLETWVAIWFFVLALGASSSKREVWGERDFDVRGVRSLKFTWFAWGLALAVHMLWWASSMKLGMWLWPGVLLLAATPHVRHEFHRYGLVSLALGYTWLATPASPSLMAFLAAITLAVGALRHTPLRAISATEATHEYRGLQVYVPIVVVDLAARTRLLVASLCFAYVGVWSSALDLGASGQPLVALAIFALVLAGYAAHRKQWRWLLPLAPFVGSYMLEHQLVPEGALGWGLTATGAGFVLLGVWLGVQWQASRSAFAAR